VNGTAQNSTQSQWGEVFGGPVVATALLDQFLHHTVVVQIEDASHRLRQHADLIPEHTRADANPMPPAAPKPHRSPRSIELSIISMAAHHIRAREF
jgi:acyl-CoA thioesterase